jgi:hypothetical protein
MKSRKKTTIDYITKESVLAGARILFAHSVSDTGFKRISFDSLSKPEKMRYIEEFVDAFVVALSKISDNVKDNCLIDDMSVFEFLEEIQDSANWMEEEGNQT